MTKKKTTVIEGGKVHPVTEGAITSPVILFDSDIDANVKVGMNAKFRLSGVVYAGKISAIDKADGTVCISLTNGLKPV